MRKIKTSLVLEGGGLRGAYTAGALSWLIDNNIEFDNAYGISTGAMYLCSYLLKSKEDLYDFSVKGLTDKRIIGIRPLLRCGRIVDYDFLYDHILIKEKHFDISPLKNIKCDAYIGLYVFEDSRTEYFSVKDIDMNTLKACTSLPIIGKPVVQNGKTLMDGGISDMIPIGPSIDDGCNRSLIIATKPQSFSRKPAKKAIVNLMKRTYPQCPQIAEDYRIRHINYEKQINMIRDLQNNNEAVYICPSQSSNVTRLGGKQEDLDKLYSLGYSDMENQKEEILTLLKR